MKRLLTGLLRIGIVGCGGNSPPQEPIMSGGGGLTIQATDADPDLLRY